MKIHKTPIATRPIVAICGTITSGLGSWLDQQLQPICQTLPTYLKSSFELTEILKQLPDLPAGARLFTADAVSMYTNIDTDHAMPVIRNFLPLTPHNEAIMEALDIIMRNNYFQFGDTNWMQRTGTAMGTPPAPMYATLYFGIYEKETLLSKYSNCLLLYKRYIDDVLGIWHCADENLDRRLWNQFQADLDEFGKLRWEVSQLSETAIFLDLQLTIKNGRVTYTLYEKPLNLHMYLPPHSAHPPGVLRGLVFGMIYRLHRLNSEPDAINDQIRTFFNRLLMRGYQESFLRPIFHLAIAHNLERQQRALAPAQDPAEERLFLHLEYNPVDPPSKKVQQLFEDLLLNPDDGPPLPTICNHKHAPIKINRLIVAYHRPSNLGDLLRPKTMALESGLPVSALCDEMTEARQQQHQHQNENAQPAADACTLLYSIPEPRR
jgi:uncharacterized protein (UPF0335 family)